MNDLEPLLKLRLPRLRRKYKSLYLIDASDVPGKHGVRNVIFKPLTRREHLLAEQDIECGSDPTDEIMRAAVLWPEVNWDEDNVFDDMGYSGYDQIAAEIVEVSGFSSNENIFGSIMESRNSLGNIDAVMTTAICSVFSMKPKEIDDLDLRDITRLFAMAESTSQMDIDVRLLLDPEYAAEAARQIERKNNKRTKIPGIPARMTRGATAPPPVPDGYESSGAIPSEYSSQIG